MKIANLVKRITPKALDKTAAERIRAKKELAARHYALQIAQAEVDYAARTAEVEQEVKVELEAIESSIALALMRAEALKETGAINEDHKARLDNAFNGSATH